MKRSVVTAVITMAMMALPLGAVAQDEISYSGSSTIGTGILVEGGAVKAFEGKTGIKFKSVEQPGSGKGIKALIDGKVTLGGASRALRPDEKKELMSHTIGYDAIAVFVHKNNPVKNLSKSQLQGIFSGKIKNWKEVGGKNAPIHPNTEILGNKRATTEFFQEHVLDGAPYGAGFKEIDLPRDQIVEIANDENGICGVSLGLQASTSADVKGKVKAISVNSVEPTDRDVKSGTYMISRPLVLATKGLPKGDVKKFIDFMQSREGQEIVSKNFVPVKK
jgi:phosphate transport system substrate-binding protein